MIITAKFASVCPTCSQRITVGSKVEWSKGGKATHVSCAPTARGEAIGAPVWTSQRVMVADMPRKGSPRGRWSGCRCGSIEGYPRDSDCRQCQHDND